MSDLAVAILAAHKHGWCSTLSCTTCPREPWVRALWAIAHDVPLDVSGKPIHRHGPELPPGSPFNGSWPRPVLVRLLDETREVRLERIASMAPDWWMYVGLLHAVLSRLDEEGRGFTTWAVPELLKLVPGNSAAARLLSDLNDGVGRRLQMTDLHAVVSEWRTGNARVAAHDDGG